MTRSCNNCQKGGYGNWPTPKRKLLPNKNDPLGWITLASQKSETQGRSGSSQLVHTLTKEATRHVRDNLAMEQRAKADREIKLAEEKRVGLQSNIQYRNEQEKLLHDSYAQMVNYWEHRNANLKNDLTLAKGNDVDVDIARYQELYQQSLAYEAEALAIAQATRDRNLAQLNEATAVTSYWSPTLNQIVHVSGRGVLYKSVHIRC